MDEVVRLGSLACLLFAAAAGAWATARVRLATGQSPVTFGRTDSAHDFLGRVFRLLVLAVAGLGLLWAAAPGQVAALGRVDAGPWAGPLGLAVLAASTAWTAAAQVQMGRSWRVGVDERPTGLVTAGLFQYSRNPVFVGMLGILAGLALALPAAPTLALLAVGAATLPVQVRLEEEHLARLHGAAYDDYRRRVPRWL